MCNRINSLWIHAVSGQIIKTLKRKIGQKSEREQNCYDRLDEYFK